MNGGEEGWIYPYVAGLIDGEGCLYILKESRNGVVIRYRLRLQVSSTTEELIEFLFDRMECGFIAHSIKSEERWKNCHHWIAIQQKAKPVLEACLPYLFIKKRQAELALQFLGGEIDGETAKAEMHKLNKRGKHASQE